jgi:hypothetical protein
VDTSQIILTLHQGHSITASVYEVYTSEITTTLETASGLSSVVTAVALNCNYDCSRTSNRTHEESASGIESYDEGFSYEITGYDDYSLTETADADEVIVVQIDLLESSGSAGGSSSGSSSSSASGGGSGSGSSSGSGSGSSSGSSSGGGSGSASGSASSLLTDVTTDTWASSVLTDATHDEFSLSYSGGRLEDGLGNVVRSAQYTYSDSGYGDFDQDDHTITTIDTVNDNGTSHVYDDTHVVARSEYEYSSSGSGQRLFGQPPRRRVQRHHHL